MNTSVPPQISYLNLIITVNDDGFLARCPGIQGGFAEGDTIEEAIFNCIDVVKMIAEYRKERQEAFELNLMEFLPEMQISLAMPIGVN